MDKKCRMRAEIDAALAAGIPLEEIYVNDGSDEWGMDGACTLSQCNELLDEWSSNMDFSGGNPNATTEECSQREADWRAAAMEQLISAETWLEENLVAEGDNR